MLSNKIEKLNLKEVLFKHDKLKDVISNNILGSIPATNHYNRNKISQLNSNNKNNYTYLNNRPLSIILNPTIDTDISPLGYINKKHNKNANKKGKKHSHTPQHNKILCKIPDKADLLSM